MMEVDIKGLIKKLNSYCTHSLEAAAGLCVSHGHYEVTVEHHLLQLLEDPNTDIHQILRHFEINPSRLIKALQHILERRRTGNSGRPVFSPLLLNWIQDAWLLCSVDYQLSQIRSGMLLQALVLRPDRYTEEDLAQLLDGIGVDELKKDLFGITAASREAEMTQEEATPGGAPTPGRPMDETAIGRFCIDFTARARAGEIDPVFGRDAEIRQMIDILARRRKNNPIVVGEPGVGKTAVVEGLALRIVEGDIPDVLKNVRLLGLDLGLLQAGAGMKGEFENRLKQVISEIKGSPTPIITFIDEAHTLIGAGGSAGSGDAANLLKPALARGELRTVAATTWSEYKKYFEKDPALERRFQIVKLDEPSVEATILMMRGLREKYEEAHGVRILEDGVIASAKLSSRYISGRQLPDKAVDLLDTAAARVRVAGGAKPAELDDLERRIQGLERELKALKRDEALGLEVDGERVGALETEIAALGESRKELTARWNREREAVKKVQELRAKLVPGDAVSAKAKKAAGKIEISDKPKDVAVEPEGTVAGKEKPTEDRPVAEMPIDEEQLRKDLNAALEALQEIQGDHPLVPIVVDGTLVANVVSAWTGIPLGKMMSDDASAILNFRTGLAGRIKGQDQAIDAVDRGIRASRAGLNNPKTPIGVFLFVGPSGVGKTEMALSVADLMFGGERFVTTINMSEFQEKHTVSRLLGSPPGYVGYGEGGVLTEAVRQRPYSIVLLDEVEKADPEVMNIFYQVFDKGMLADGEGRVIDFKNTVIFLTSNLATDLITGLSTGPVPPSCEEIVKAIRPTLSQHFKPALLARMEIVPFYTLGTDVLKDIVVLKLKQIGNRLMESHKMKFDIDPAVVDLIANRCTEVETGARNIDHIIRQTLLPLLSTSILEKMAEGPLGDSVKLGVAEDESFTLNFAEPEPE
ncbi:MAG: type VI secretion system ATPase TssH [Candidatus Eisenbacteria bacterium]|uniref:Type VI secretion system ATPase TssH n=1 Tax=Eiseniibacteriota bacterium TaxID=2212470 RepID=A0A948RYM1_UNCEI|nr:type VI secretion system ATPase TssH [Candidatus Eisenbacteria bacterium]MBU2692826.1 type VI secretion system ATPase TssH [Candidatus Eisenbacteria bacterium]